MRHGDDLDIVLERFLGEGPNEIADEVIEASLRTIETTSQRRAGFGPRRSSSMTTLGKVALAAAAVIAVALVGNILMPETHPGSGGSAIPSIAATGPISSLRAADSPAASAAPSTATRSALMAPIGYAGMGTIVFTRSDAGGAGTTWTIRPDGSAESPLRVTQGWSGQTDLPGTGCCAIFSPDGRQVAVGYDETDASRGPGTLMAAQILDLDGTPLGPDGLIPQFCGGCGSIRKINYVPGAWSADGTVIAAAVWNDTDPTVNGINLAPLGPNAHDWNRQVTGPNTDTPVAFSPDSTRLLFVRGTATDAAGTLMVATINRSNGPVVAGAPIALSAPGERVAADGYFGPAASWSSDGRMVAFAATDETGSSGRSAVYLVPAAGGKATRIAGPANSITSARYSPDGAWIAFDQPVGGPLHDEFIVRPDGSGLTNLTASLDPGVCCGRWSPDSSALLVAGTKGQNVESDLLIIPVNGEPIRQLTQTPAFYSDFSWGPVAR